MIVGIVNMYSTLYGCRYLIHAIQSLGYRTHVLDGVRTSQKDIADAIKHSSVTHWIFSGSPTSVLAPDAPQVPLSVLRMKEKRIMCLCYSMESVLMQLGYAIKDYGSMQTEVFPLAPLKDHALFDGIKDPMVMRRNHERFISSSAIHAPIHLLASYKGQVMIAILKQTTLIQFHPEKSVDGKKLLLNWLQTSS
jgi:anthranilate/para-aminobenzoate synthase component II